MGALETVLATYIPLLEALDAGDLEAAAFFLDVAAEAERAAPEVLVAAREVLPSGTGARCSIPSLITGSIMYNNDNYNNNNNNDNNDNNRALLSL